MEKNYSANWRFTAWRKNRGLSQEDVARALGVPQQYISDLELGKTPPSLARIRKLQDVYGVELDVLGFRCVVVGETRLVQLGEEGEEGEEVHT